jgi:hypothetical protein
MPSEGKNRYSEAKIYHKDGINYYPEDKIHHSEGTNYHPEAKKCPSDANFWGSDGKIYPSSEPRCPRGYSADMVATMRQCLQIHHFNKKGNHVGLPLQKQFGFQTNKTEVQNEHTINT